MLFPVQIHTLCIGDVLLLGVSKKTVKIRSTLMRIVGYTWGVYSKRLVIIIKHCPMTYSNIFPVTLDHASKLEKGCEVSQTTLPQI